MVYEFAIQKKVLNNGKEILTPVVREKRKKWFIFPLPEKQWDRIVCIYGKYLTLELIWEPELTFAQCQEHIDGYQAKLIGEKSNEVAMTEFQNLEEKII